METYKLNDVMKILDIDRGRINEWISRSYIDNEFDIKKGSRIHKEYSRTDIYAIGTFKYMLDVMWMQREISSKIVKALAQNNAYFNDYVFIIFVGNGLFISNKLTENCDYAIVMNMKKIVKSIDKILFNDCW